MCHVTAIGWATRASPVYHKYFSPALHSPFSSTPHKINLPESSLLPRATEQSTFKFFTTHLLPFNSLHTRCVPQPFSPSSRLPPSPRPKIHPPFSPRSHLKSPPTSLLSAAHQPAPCPQSSPWPVLLFPALPRLEAQPCRASTPKPAVPS